MIIKHPFAVVWTNSQDLQNPAFKTNYIKMLSDPRIKMNPNGLKNELVQRLYAHMYFVISVLQLAQSRLQDSDSPCAVCDDHSDTPEIRCSFVMVIMMWEKNIAQLRTMQNALILL